MTIHIKATTDLKKIVRLIPVELERQNQFQKSNMFISFSEGSIARSHLPHNCNPQVTDAAPAPVTRPSADESSINQGFQRFLSVLNKGVDLDLLSRIVNDDSEDIPAADNLLSSEPPAVATTPYLPPSNKSQPLNIKDENKNESRCHSFGSRSRSRSPPAVKKQKREGEEKATANEQHEQLQNILKTLGLSLGVDEMSRLANRTHERLYGTKHESTHNQRERERQTRGSHVSHREGSSSSSSSRSSSSRSTSRSSSSSSSCHQRSHSRDSGRRRASECSDSTDKSRVRWTHRETKEQLQNRDKYAKPLVETYEPPQLQNKAHPHPDAVSKIPDHSLSHYSQYNGYQSDFYNEATSSYWTSNEGAFPPSYYPNGQPDQQNTYHPFPVSVVEPTRLYPHESDLKDLYPLANPDLAESEGQIESTSDPWCLQEIGIGKREKCLKLLTHSECKKQHLCSRVESRHLFQEKSAAEKCRALAVLEAKAQPEKNGNKPIANNRQSEEEKQSQTEEDIKANLRKKVCKSVVLPLFLIYLSCTLLFVRFVGQGLFLPSSMSQIKAILSKFLSQKLFQRCPELLEETSWT